MLHDLLDQADQDALALTAADGSLTYRELREASLRLAGRLLELGVRRHDRVVVSLPVSKHVPALLYAVSRIGAAFCVLHEQVRDLDHVLTDLEPVLLVGAERDGVPTLSAAEVAEAAVGGPVVEPPAPSPEDVVCLIYTSGSTAKPKAVVCEHRQMVFAARAIHDRIGYTRDDVVFSPLSLSFDYGLYQLFLAALGSARLWLAGADEGGLGLLKAVTDTGATVLAGMPSMTETLVWLLERTDVVPALRLLTTTGAAMKRHTAAALRAKLPGMRLQIMYGLTECKRVSIMPPDEDLRRPGASGRPLDGTEVLVRDGDGRLLGPGEVGEFVVRGPHLMSGYWRRETQSEERFPVVDGVRELRTGDYGWLDDDGYLHVDGRRDDIYKERGFRVSTTEVEAAAHEVPGVRRAAVIPPRDGARSVLVVTGEATPQEVLRDLGERIEAFKVPRRCVVVDEIPLSGNGKIARDALVRMISEAGAPGAR